MSLYYRPFTGNKEVYEYDVIITIHLAAHKSIMICNLVKKSAKIRKKQQKKGALPKKANPREKELSQKKEP